MVWDKGKGMAKTDAYGVSVGVGAATLTPSVVDGLISVFAAEISGTLCPAVDARELHQFLGVKRDFSNWIKRRIAEYGLVEGEDYVSIAKMGNGCDDKGRVVPIEYHLKLYIAKELAMVEKNAKAVARRYFIDCESRLLAQLLAQTGQTRPAAPTPDAGEGFGILDDL
jgi:phage anti-repressor protein